ncbi:30S ribosomal protein S17 [Candidatus Woesearchaeota archaeon]|nr:30S ribosomal protein S17 [Candidatus Woesearchaeota archaeon]
MVDCKDVNCPFHGKLTVHGRVFKGVVTSAKMHKTVTVKWERKYYLQKYERFETRFSKVKAHNPDCVKAKEGDIVLIQECKPISKTKHFVVIKVLNKQKGNSNQTIKS